VDVKQGDIKRLTSCDPQQGRFYWTTEEMKIF